MIRARFGYAWISGALLLSGCFHPDLPEGCRRRPPKEEPPASFEVTPGALRARLFRDNTEILAQWNRVHAAKESVAVARASLLPSINLGSLLSIAEGPAFVLSSVEMLVPFLLPSKWFEAREERALLDAELVGLRLIKLNVLASASALVLEIRGDEALVRVQEAEARDLERIALEAEMRAKAGTGSQAEADTASGKAALARIAASKLEELADSERASLRTAIGMGPSTALGLDWPGALPSEEEEADAEAALARALALAPESEQIRLLKRAASLDRWSKVFAFLGGADLGATGAPASLSGLGSGASLSLGFATFPTIRLASRNLVELRIRAAELENELGAVVATALDGVRLASRRLADAEDAAAAFAGARDDAWMRYRAGMDGIEVALAARHDWRLAELERTRAATALEQARLTLHRVFLSEFFADVEPCAAN